MARPRTVEEYIRSFPDEVQNILEEVRQTLHRVVPDAGEEISYQIPTITLGGKYVVYFAAWKDHISVYPLPAGDDAFQRDIAPYKSGKGTAKFPLSQPIPYGLIEQIAERLVYERRNRR